LATKEGFCTVIDYETHYFSFTDENGNAFCKLIEVRNNIVDMGGRVDICEIGDGDLCKISFTAETDISKEIMKFAGTLENIRIYI
jgi:hypothetical protein